MPTFYDDDGKVLATKGLRVKPPWVVLKSNKFDGHYYFFNVETKTSAWSLEASVIGLSTPGSIKIDDDGAAEEKSSRSDSNVVLPKIENLNLKNGKKGMTVDVNEDNAAKSASNTVKPGTPASPLHTWQQKGGFKGGSSLDGEDGASYNKRQYLTVSANTPTGTGTPQPNSGGVSPLPRNSFKRGFMRASNKAAVHAELNAEEHEDELDLDKAQYHVVEGLGSGGYAVVVKVQEVDTGKFFAMKVITKSKRHGRRHRDRMKTELKVMTEIDESPFLQRCLNCFENAAYVYFILDLQTGGDLFFHLVNKISDHGWGFPEDQVRILLAETFLALEHMHKFHMIHRDVKVENIMLDGEGHVKLVDFGLAVEIHEDIEPLSPTGSFIYMAPEMIKDRIGGRVTDWWALGVLAYALLTGRTPWSSLTDKEIIRKEIQNLKVAPPRRLSPPAGQLVCALMTQDYKKRLGSVQDSDIRGAAFFQSIDWAGTERKECPPAFVPGETNVTKQDNTAAMAAYAKTVLNNQEGDDAPEGSWHMGLPRASKFIV
jgi:serine/threonine protein kinase